MLPLQLLRSLLIPFFPKDLIIKHSEGNSYFVILGFLLVMRVLQIRIEAIIDHLDLGLVKHMDQTIADLDMTRNDSREVLTAESFAFQLIEKTLHFHFRLYS